MQEIGVRNLEASIILAGLIDHVPQTARLEFEKKTLQPLITAYDNLWAVPETSRATHAKLISHQIRQWWQSSWFTAQIMHVRAAVMHSLNENITSYRARIFTVKKQKIIISGLGNIEFGIITRKIRDEFRLTPYLVAYN
jgi:CRISPR/Cas system-associated endoribonuclease Cas2